LRVVPEVSNVGAKAVSKSVNGQTFEADYFEIRKIDTRVLIPSGNTLVMGGLVNDSVNTGNTKVPFFGDIPFLGYAFRSESKSQVKKNLIIFITPTIVDQEDFQPTKSTFLKTKVPDNKSVDFGTWDRGKPQDWSKLWSSKKKSTDEIDETELSSAK
jgi:type II secretory pathway component GspD/PulD (secretin)